MSDNPFHKDYEAPTVVVRPTPGGRTAPPASGDMAPPPQPPILSVSPEAPAEAPAGAVTTGQPPLIVAATPLLQLLGRLRNTLSPPDPGELRVRTIQAIRQFEAAGRAANIPNEVLHPARYALCASIDDVVLRLPWGTASPWVQASLVSTFHQEVIAGEGFFVQLAALKREPARNLALLELMYLCLSLGYQGQYRLSRQGPAQLDHLREDIYQTLAKLRPPVELGLSPRWQGVDAAYRPSRAAVPVWVMAAAAAAVVGLAWLYASSRVNGTAEAAVIPPVTMPALDRPPQDGKPPRPEPPVPPPSPALLALQEALGPQIRDRQMLVSDSPQNLKVTIFGTGMFDSGSATVRPAFVEMLRQIGTALNRETGSVQVTGYTDNVPIHVPFPNNIALSQARAQAASAVLLQRLDPQRRPAVLGMGENGAVAPNDSEEHRAANRRVEITLQRGG